MKYISAAVQSPPRRLIVNPLGEETLVASQLAPRLFFSVMPRQKLGRSWGTRFDALAAVDSVPSSPECTLTHPQKLKPAIQMGESDNNHDRVVHDASIFIGR